MAGWEIQGSSYTEGKNAFSRRGGRFYALYGQYTEFQGTLSLYIDWHIRFTKVRTID